MEAVLCLVNAIVTPTGRALCAILALLDGQGLIVFGVRFRYLRIIEIASSVLSPHHDLFL